MTSEPAPPTLHADPRQALAKWANDDEWVRRIVRLVLTTGKPLTTDDVTDAYSLFRQEKSLDERVQPIEPKLEIEVSADAAEKPLIISRLSNVAGVNAIVTGSVIEPHAGLTILYGENGTGKTGYARIFKMLANSRTADLILGDIVANSDISPSATIDYSIGDEQKQFSWTGERGKVPFTRMSIFDSPAVNFHVDDDLEYVYVPSVLSLFNHVVAGLRGVQERMDANVRALTSPVNILLDRFPRESTVYPEIETLGVASDLESLRARASTDPQVEDKIESLRTSVAALAADMFSTQIASRQRAKQVLTEATELATSLNAFDGVTYGRLITTRVQLRADYRIFRTELFGAADLPAEPEESWESFIRAGDTYRQHLDALGVHDSERCLYCRQPLQDDAKNLLQRYSSYLVDKISSDLDAVSTELKALTSALLTQKFVSIAAFIAEFSERDERPAFFDELRALYEDTTQLMQAVRGADTLPSDLLLPLPARSESLAAALMSISTELAELEDQSRNRLDTLAQKRRELNELVAGAELAKSWSLIESHVRDAKEAHRIRTLSQRVPTLSRSVTALAKAASNELINNSFEELFREECKLLDAPELKLQFVGREGKAQRRKTIIGKHKPSKIFSEGEQKVLAIADFLAEARLAGIAAPVVFDDPVSSLDHRRVNEVAERIALLADGSQVIVFTHDILFVSKLLHLFEVSKRCSYFQVTDEGGKGKVTRTTGPRWDTLSGIKGKINSTIQAVRAEDGETREALIRAGYGWIRSWCEVFTETELLQGVTQRYQAHVRMTGLSNIKVDKLPGSITTVTSVFEDACRFIDGHSQPLASLGVSPSLAGLEAHWQELQDCKKSHDSK